MFIREIVLENFKSYGKRTVIQDIDPHFNAITGLNGSGKSNILDAVCFALGVSNLKEVRAAHLKDLIHIGSTGPRDKAIVSLIFDNTDKNTSPPGYEGFDTITISKQILDGGRLKCMVNGTLAPASRVADVLQSAHLNVNNPHFIVMQGRITRVLNMKAIEILSMIEEATGTKMYDDNRAQAISLINKKSQHHLENENLIKEALVPLLERIRASNEEYDHYCKAKSRLEKLERQQVAYTYLSLQERIADEASSVEQLEAEISDLKESISKCKETCRQLREEIEAFEKQQEQDEETRTLQAEFNARTKEEEAAADAYRACSEKWQMENGKLMDLEKRVVDGELEKRSKQQAVEKLTAELQVLKTAHDHAAEELRKAKEFCDIIDCGMAISAEGRASTLLTRLSAAKDDQRNAELKASSVTCRLNILENEVKTKEAVIVDDRANYNRAVSMLRKAAKTFDDVQGEIAHLNYDDHSVEQCSNELRGCTEEMHRLQQRTASLESRFPSTNFEYSLPEPNFNRSRVLGTVANLIRLKDARAAAAVEVIAGQRLYWVVVDCEETVQLLITKGKLLQRHSFIPLNVIRSRRINDGTIHRAQRLVGKDNCDLAVNFLDFDPKVQKAIEFVFGDQLICPTSDIAKKVAFHPDVMQVTVTFDGDQFNPVGTLCGGSKPSRGYLMELRAENQSLYDNLSTMRDRVHHLRSRLDEMKVAREKYLELYDTLKRVQIDKEQLEKAVEESRTTACKRHIAEARSEIESLQAELADLERRRERAIAEADEIERILNGSQNNKETELRKADQARRAAEKEEAARRHSLEEKEKEFYNVEGDVKVLDEMIVESNNEIAVMRNVLAQMEEEKSRQKALLEKFEAATKVAREALFSRRGAQQAASDEMEAKSSRAASLQRQAQQDELKVRELEHKEKRARTSLDEWRQKMKKYVASHSWIQKEKDKFGQPNSEFPQGSSALQAVEQEIAELKSTVKPVQVESRSKHVGVYESLCKKLRIIEEKRAKCEKDKEEIMTVLTDMQEKKRCALEIALHQVNKDFDAIMNIMLPYANVKLVPVNPDDVLKGLEIKVAFSGMWLDSLSELSGGQRSLVALALIFAMLLFKPAPVYILDEIDAALDIVHTESIGEMIREKFPHSQFLIVSLKEGMFSNANVLYRTRLENGQSYISRSVGSKHPPMSRDALAAVRKRHQKEEQYRAAVRSKLADIRNDISMIDRRNSITPTKRTASEVSA
uniref:Structural maintenance of chromosomes protein n=1 Tax=Trichuris muris TaxID=70415 RepID=A0A5S6QVE9_TRIMR